MNTVTRQLRIDPAESKEVAEWLIGGTFQCPLEGEYVVVETPGTLPMCVSDALPPKNRFLMVEIPAEYTFPLLTWFRGLTAELRITDDTLGAYIELDVQNKTTGAASGKPAMPSLKLPQFSFGEKPKSAEEKPKTPDLPEPEELPPPKDD